MVSGMVYINDMQRIQLSVYRTNSIIQWVFIHSLSILSDDRSKASSKTIPSHSAI